jgi:hypothetical protein
MRRLELDCRVRDCYRWKLEIIWRLLMILSRLFKYIQPMTSYSKGQILFILLLLLIVSWLISRRLYISCSRLSIFTSSCRFHLKKKYNNCKMILINSLNSYNPNDIIHSLFIFYIILSSNTILL